jgi:hypothetical protein
MKRFGWVREKIPSKSKEPKKAVFADFDDQYVRDPIELLRLQALSEDLQFYQHAFGVLQDAYRAMLNVTGGEAVETRRM